MMDKPLLKEDLIAWRREEDHGENTITFKGRANVFGTRFGAERELYPHDLMMSPRGTLRNATREIKEEISADVFAALFDPLD